MKAWNGYFQTEGFLHFAFAVAMSTEAYTLSMELPDWQDLIFTYFCAFPSAHQLHIGSRGMDMTKADFMTPGFLKGRLFLLTGEKTETVTGRMGWGCEFPNNTLCFSKGHIVDKCMDEPLPCFAGQKITSPFHCPKNVSYSIISLRWYCTHSKHCCCFSSFTLPLISYIPSWKQYLCQHLCNSLYSFHSVLHRGLKTC